MKDIIDALIFNHEVKIGRLPSIITLKNQFSGNKIFSFNNEDEDEKKMTFWEKLKAPHKPVNLIKLLNVIQESRIKDIQEKMKEQEDPFVSNVASKKKEPIPESYNFVSDILKFESLSSLKRR
jgi:hypothetical protein